MLANIDDENKSIEKNNSSEKLTAQHTKSFHTTTTTLLY